jgi:hypothetical protein
LQVVPSAEPRLVVVLHDDASCWPALMRFADKVPAGPAAKATMQSWLPAANPASTMRVFGRDRETRKNHCAEVKNHFLPLAALTGLLERCPHGRRELEVSPRSRFNLPRCG